MNRLISAMKLDVTLQVRTQLYSIGIFVGMLVAAVFAWLATPEQLPNYVPTLMLLVVGGSTFLYVAAMILFEKDQGTLSAIIVSPLTSSQYLWSKIITLTALATLEGVIMVVGAMAIMRLSATLAWPNFSWLLLGIVAIGIVYTLLGIVLIVRYDSITDFMIPMAFLAVILQLPFVYFLGWITHPILLIIPTSAPTVLMQAAFGPLATWEWVYGVAYTLLIIVGLTIWAHRSFETHIVAKVG